MLARAGRAAIARTPKRATSTVPPHRTRVASENLHEPPELLSEATKDKHRAVVSLMEELEAIDWYQQRAEATTDPELAAVLLHNKGEEIEHAMMVLEWLRRHDETIAAHAETYLFTKAPITEIEEAAEKEEGDASPRGRSASNGAAADGSLGIGSLRG